MTCAFILKEISGGKQEKLAQIIKDRWNNNFSYDSDSLPYQDFPRFALLRFALANAKNSNGGNRFPFARFLDDLKVCF